MADTLYFDKVINLFALFGIICSLLIWVLELDASNIVS